MTGRPWRRAAASALAVALLGTGVLGCQPDEASRRPLRRPAPSALQRPLDSLVAAGLPGAVARIEGPTGDRSAAAGVADLATGRRLRPSARFRVGSITKTFVATVVLQLVGEGRLDLDAAVGDVLPAVLPEGEPATLRQLLNHTSGLADHAAEPALLAGIADRRTFTPAELVALVADRPRTFPPGSGWSYSNTGYVVAGLLVEAVTGSSLADELERRIFEPLGLRDTTFGDGPQRPGGRLAAGYVPADVAATADGRPLDVTALDASHAWAAGAIVSSAADLARFSRALLGGDLLSPELLREMQTTVPEDPGDPTFSYGLGIERVQDPCGANWGHSGSIFGYSTLAFTNETTGRTAVLATTAFPTPTAAEEPLADAIDTLLCGEV